jgi:hypothetical protein
VNHWYTPGRLNELAANLALANSARRTQFVANAIRQGGTEKRVAALEEELARHELVIRVLIRMLMDRGIATQEQFEACLQQVDLEDGVADGKATPPAPPAPEPPKPPLDLEEVRRRHRERKRRGKV